MTAVNATQHNNNNNQLPTSTNPNFKIPVNEIHNFMVNKNIMIGTIQETRLTVTSRSNLQHIGEYTIICKGRTRNTCGGICFMVRKSVAYKNLVLPQPNGAFL